VEDGRILWQSADGLYSRAVNLCAVLAVGHVPLLWEVELADGSLAANPKSCTQKVKSGAPSEPGADRGPRAGSPRGVVVATGRGFNPRIAVMKQADSRGRSLPLAVLMYVRSSLLDTLSTSRRAAAECSPG
jgi:hypothetical protein